MSRETGFTSFDAIAFCAKLSISKLDTLGKLNSTQYLFVRLCIGVGFHKCMK